MLDDEKGQHLPRTFVERFQRVTCEKARADLLSQRWDSRYILYLALCLKNFQKCRVTLVVVTLRQEYAAMVSSGLHVRQWASRFFLLFFFFCNVQRREKNEGEERINENTSVLPRVSSEHAAWWFLGEAAVKTEPRLGGKEKGSLRSELVRPPSLAVDTRCPFADILLSAAKSLAIRPQRFDKTRLRRQSHSRLATLLKFPSKYGEYTTWEAYGKIRLS